MAERFNPGFMQACIDAFLSGKTSSIKMIMLTSAYTYDPAHRNLSDIASGRSSIATLGGIGTAIVNTDDVRITATAPGTDPDFAADAGVTVQHAWVYYDSGVESTSTLMTYFDFTARSIDGGLNITLPTEQLGEWRNPA